MTLIVMLVCFLVNLISVLATVYIVLNDRMTVNVERSCVMACKIYMRYRLRVCFDPVVIWAFTVSIAQVTVFRIVTPCRTISFFYLQGDLIWFRWILMCLE